MLYNVVELFKSVQGEGIFSGTPMLFIRLQGCSVGKKVCHHCDTDFDTIDPWKGGGNYTADWLVNQAGPYTHICVTGGEPLDCDLRPLFFEAVKFGHMLHIETSGTVNPPWLSELRSSDSLWLTVSPKPGYLPRLLQLADEIKVIVGGLGNGPGWMTPKDILDFAVTNHENNIPENQTPIYLQPRNKKHEVDLLALGEAEHWVQRFPQYFRLSPQVHKFLQVR